MEAEKAHPKWMRVAAGIVIVLSTLLVALTVCTLAVIVWQARLG